MTRALEPAQPAQPADLTEPEQLRAIWQNTIRELASPLAQIDWAEDEIKRAIGRHPAEADTLFHSFSLLRAPHERMGIEFVYRAHCRELLERVASGTDTRPGTAAEVCLLMAEVSQAAPLTTEAVGLYGRMWTSAFPDQPEFGVDLEHYEAMHGSAIDAAEQLARDKLTVTTRLLGRIECGGRHHGQPVLCKYTTRDQPE